MIIKILKANSVNELELNLNEMLQQGWKLKGDFVCDDSTLFYQMIVKN